jgi:hypothetical protein
MALWKEPTAPNLYLHHPNMVTATLQQSPQTQPLAQCNHVHITHARSQPAAQRSKMLAHTIQAKPDHVTPYSTLPGVKFEWLYANLTYLGV